MKNIKSFLKRVFGLEIKMTEQEQLIYNIFVKLLDHPETNKVLYNDSSSYLSNMGMEIEVSVDGNEVILKLGQDVMSIVCTSRFMLHLSNVVNNSVERSVNNLHKKMMDNQNSSLKKIGIKIDPDTSTISIEA